MLGGTGRAGVRGLVMLPDGGGVAVGGFDGQLVAGGTLTGAAADGFALRLSPAGTVQWSVGLTGPGDAEMTCVAARADGLAMAGTATGAAQLGGRAVQAAGQPGAVVARVDMSGAVQWVQAIGSSSYAVPTALAWTPDGDVVVTGYFAGTLDPAGAGLPGAGSLDVWVARLAGADGKVIWIHRAGGPGPDSAHAVTANESGVVVAGAFQRWADFSATTLRSEDSTADPFVAAVGADGFAAAWSIDAAGPAIAHGVVASKEGRVGLAITFGGSLEAGRRIEARPSGSGLVALVQSSGEVAWARLTPGSSAEAIAADGDRFVLAGASGAGGYVAAVSSAGQPGWSAAVGGAPAAVAAAGGRVLVGGSAAGRLTVGKFSAAVAGESDGFVARLPAR